MSKSACFFILAFLLMSAAASAQMIITNEPEEAKKPSSVKFFNKTEAGVSFGIGSFNADVENGIQKQIRNDEIPIVLQTTNGIMYMNQLALGVTVGAERWTNGLFWPVYGYLGYDFKPATNSIFANLYLGYGFGTRYSTTYVQEGTGGFSFSIGVGYKMPVTKKLKFMYEVFYKYQSIESAYVNSWEVTNDTGTVTRSSLVDYKFPLHFMGFRIGITIP